MGLRPHLRWKGWELSFDQGPIRASELPRETIGDAWGDWIYALQRPWNFLKRKRLDELGLGVFVRAISIDGLDPIEWISPAAMSEAAERAKRLLVENDPRFEPLKKLYGRAVRRDAASIREAVAKGALPRDWLEQGMMEEFETVAKLSRWASEHGLPEIVFDFS